MRGVSSAFRELARTLEAVDTDKTVGTELDITAITPVGENIVTKGGMSVEVQVRVLNIDFASLGDGVEIDPGDVELAGDGSLCANFVATVKQSRTEEEEKEAVTKGTRPTTSVNESTSRDNHSGSDPKAIEEDEVESEKSQTTDTDSDPGRRGSGSSEDEPPYRDPDQLREVYDACETFAEMTDALDVHVTPQTVRRYMIKHGIHEPSPKSKTADRLLNTDSDSVSVQTESAKQESPSETPRSSIATESSEATDSGSPNETRTENSNGTEPEIDRASSRETRIRNGTESRVTETADDSGETTGEGEGETEPPNNLVTEDGSESESVPDESDGDSVPDGGRNRPAGSGDYTDDWDVAEEIELPEHLTLEEVKEIVRSSKTLYEAQQQLGLDRDAARQLLQDLNLLGFVHGRLSTRHLEKRTIEEINRRIRSTLVAEQA